MKPLDNFVSIRGVYARSVNLLRDGNDLGLLQAYLPTAKTLQTLEQFKSGFTKHPAERAYALIGPYGSGKSAFALFLSSLLATEESQARHIASDKFKAIAPVTSAAFDKAVAGGSGFLRVSVNGTPDSLIRQLLLALADSMAQAGFDQSRVATIKAAAVPSTPMDEVLAHLQATQDCWAKMGVQGCCLPLMSWVSSSNTSHTTHSTAKSICCNFWRNMQGKAMMHPYMLLSCYIRRLNITPIG